MARTDGAPIPNLPERRNGGRGRTRCAVSLRIAIAVLAVVACRREARNFSAPAFTNANAAGVRVDEDASRSLAALPSAGTPGPYAGNAWALGEGQRLYKQMNCVGCHAQGGGGMGPPLMDGAWIYGADDASIFKTIVSGRPNGMPAYRGRLSDQQVWQLVGYVKSLSGSAPKPAEASRDDHMSVRPGPVRTDPPAVRQQEAQ